MGVANCSVGCCLGFSTGFSTFFVPCACPCPTPSTPATWLPMLMVESVSTLPTNSIRLLFLREEESTGLTKEEESRGKRQKKMGELRHPLDRSFALFSLPHPSLYPAFRNSISLSRSLSPRHTHTCIVFLMCSLCVPNVFLILSLSDTQIHDLPHTYMT
jgi:hypothetical protein